MFTYHPVEGAQHQLNKNWWTRHKWPYLMNMLDLKYQQKSKSISSAETNYFVHFAMTDPVLLLQYPTAILAMIAHPIASSLVLCSWKLRLNWVPTVDELYGPKANSKATWISMFWDAPSLEPWSYLIKVVHKKYCNDKTKQHY